MSLLKADEEMKTSKYGKIKNKRLVNKVMKEVRKFYNTSSNRRTYENIIDITLEFLAGNSKTIKIVYSGQ